MEYLFENVNTYTRTQMEEYWEYTDKPYLVRSLVFLGIALAVILGICVWMWPWIDTLIIVVLVLMVVSIVRRLNQGKKQGQTAYEQLLSYYDDVMPAVTVRFGETIFVQGKDTTRVIEYRKIKEVVALKHSYAIYDKKPGVILLDRNGFTKGTFEEFKQFLRAKRPDLTIPE